MSNSMLHVSVGLDRTSCARIKLYFNVGFFGEIKIIKKYIELLYYKSGFVK